MRNLGQLAAETAAMRASRRREERWTRIFLAASTGVAGFIAALALGIVFAAWPPSLDRMSFASRDASEASPPVAPAGRGIGRDGQSALRVLPDSRRYLEAWR